MAQKIRVYSAMPLSVSISTIFACVITSPVDGGSVTQGTPVVITGKISRGAVVVQVKLGSTVLGSASIVGLDWSYSWTPQVGDVGAGVLSAVATSPSAEVAPSPNVAITVASSVFGGDYGALFSGYSGLTVRNFKRGDLGVTGTTGTGKSAWANQLGDCSAMAPNSATNGIGSLGALNGKQVIVTNGATQAGLETFPSNVVPATKNRHRYMVLCLTATTTGFLFGSDGGFLGVKTGATADQQIYCGSAGAASTGEALNVWHRSRYSWIGGLDVIRVGSHEPTPVSTSNNGPGNSFGFAGNVAGASQVALMCALIVDVEGPLATFLTAAAAADVTLSSFWAGATAIEI